MTTSQPIDVADLIRELNESNDTLEDQYLRARDAADRAARAEEAAGQAAASARQAKVAHQAIQAEQRRHAALPRQVMFALVTVALDGLACYFAAQALDGSQDATLVWTFLFLAVLAGGEVTLDVYRDRHRRAWRSLVAFLGAFILLLGVLRFWYLATIGVGDPVAAVAGAALFTGATAVFVFIGYRALRAAETPLAWRARRRARAASRAAQEARESADRDAVHRDQLVDAYLRQIRRAALRTCPTAQLPTLEAAAREHLHGKGT
ncbi:hypothetical protein [Trebonia sp.]|uniref:hypothetical protein n=1 Tax=Trebonia sp. TaxID=2767075 RepID=UPI00260DC672|nr:hypothetical protein [Trebonia sp.]